MINDLPALLANFTAAMRAYVAHPDEAMLERAYELGRQVVGDDRALLDLIAAYHQELAEFLQTSQGPDERDRMLALAHAFLSESLASVAMAQVGLQDTIARLRREVAERLAAEQSLRQSEERYRLIVETAQEGIWIINAQAETTFVNGRMAALLGRTVDEMAGASLFAFTDAEGQALARANIARVRGGDVQQHDFKFVHRDGHGVWVRVSPTPRFDDQGHYVGVMKMATDISAWRRAQDERDRFFTLSPDMLIVAGMDGYFKDHNPAFEQTLGYTREELRARPFMDFLHPDDLAASAAEVARLRTGVPTADFENRFICKDGSYRWFLWTATLEPEQQAIYAAARDITERKQAEAALRQARDQLEQRVEERTAELAAANVALHAAKEEADTANDAKSEFLSRMSHELRTPLNAILGFGQILEMHDLSAWNNEGVRHILKAGRHLLQLIDEVLDIASIEAGRMALSIEPIDVAQCVTAVLDLAAPLAAPRRIRLYNGVSPAEGWHVMADQQRLNQVLLNLVSNAIKYNREAGEVVLAASIPAEGRLRLMVRDTGPGIRPDELSRLFVPFERLAAASGIEGTGIGLVLSKRLVEAMDGAIGVESEVGKGSTFWVELPVAMASTPSRIGRQLGGEGQAETVAPVLRSTVLYIEDNLSNVALIEHLLGTIGEMRLLTAMQGGLGLDLAREHQPDLILLDIHLPDIMGDEVLRRLRAEPRTRDIPVVVLSADAAPRAIARLREAGAAAYLTKPLDVKVFLTCMHEILGGEKV